MKSSSNSITITIIGLVLVAFASRLNYLFNTNPFIDEFTTVLAAQAILARGVPILPSGLFYEHGMIFSYLEAPFVGMSETPFLFIFARLPSLFISTITVPLIYFVGQRWFSPQVGLIAATLLAFSPEGMVWGGRARMYALAQLLILVLAFLAYQGSINQGKPRWRWIALGILLLSLLTQFGTLMFVPPLVVAILVVVCLSHPTIKIQNKVITPFFSQIKKQPINTLCNFLYASWIWQTVGLIAVIGIGVLVKRLGQPLGASKLSNATTNNPITELFTELWNTIAYQVSLALNWESSLDFLARQFGVPHHLWLTIAAILGLFAFFILFITHSIIPHQPSTTTTQPPSPNHHHPTTIPYIYLWLVFGLVILEMITLLEPFRRNPRYIVMGLPLFYLIVAVSLNLLLKLPSLFTNLWWRRGLWIILSLFLTAFCIFNIQGTWLDLTIAYRTPEPAYDDAFSYVATHRHPDDVVLTMNTSAAALYLDRVDFFALQGQKAHQFLLNVDTNPVDRWLGIPWIGSATAFNQLLNTYNQVWFVVDSQRLTGFGFYQGDWIALLNTQMEQVWTKDNAFVYRSRPNRIPIPTAPTTILNAQFQPTITLHGYTLDTNQSPPQLTLFWRTSAPIQSNYTIFIHLRDQTGANIQQWDRQPLNGAYPTSQWQPTETFTDPIPLTLPDSFPTGQYTLALGLYDLNTLQRLALSNDTSGENAVIITSVTIK